MKKMIQLKAKARISANLLLLRNLFILKGISPFPQERSCEILYRGLKKSEASQAFKIYTQLNYGATLSTTRRALYKLISKKIILAAIKKNGPTEKVVAINIYYLNTRDIQENTIHEGFIGVIPEEEGRGIASKLRKIAKEHFLSQGFKGISTRISLNNLPSLHSAEKLGFKPVEKYTDSSTNEERYYMICELEGNQK